MVTPGLVDCHTHLAFGGWRADEFEQRIRGKSYLDIAAGRRRDRPHRAAHAGGVRGRRSCAARAASSSEMRALGVTTVECKSGYGLDREHELQLLRVYRRLAASRASRGSCRPFSAPTSCRRSIAARPRAIPAAADRGADPRAGARRAWPSAATSSSRIGVQPLEEARRDPAGREGGRAGAEAPRRPALFRGGGAELAAELGALSADHLEHASDAGIAAMAARRDGGGEPSARDSLYLDAAADAGAPTHRGGRRRSRSPPTSIPGPRRAITCRSR